MARAKSLPMPQDIGNKSAHITLRIAASERTLMLEAMRHVGFTSISDFVRHAIVKTAEDYLGTPGASDRMAAAEEVQATMYGGEPPAHAAPSLSEVFGVPLFPPQHGSSVEAVGLNDETGDWL